MSLSENVGLPDSQQLELINDLGLEVLGSDRHGHKKDSAQSLSDVLSNPAQVESSSESKSAVTDADKTVAADAASVTNSSLECGTISDQPSKSYANSEHSVGNAAPMKIKSFEEKVDSPIRVEATFPQSKVAKSPVAQESPPGDSLPVVEVAVELHEEEEDYGDEEDQKEEGELGEIEKLRDAMEKSQTTEGSTSETTFEGDVDKVSSASRELPPSSSSYNVILAPVKKETRGVGFTVEAPERVNPPVEAKCPASSLVYIRCLVRPFTASQLATMLEVHFDRASELWLDRIKSTAVARFSDETIATKCREGLDGCRWPSVNPRILQCEFASEALLSWLKEHGEMGDKPPPRHLLGDTSDRGRVGRERTEKPTDNAKSTGGAKRRQSLDNAKDTMKDSGGRGKQDAKGEESSKSLDDLFKKTITTPSVYWLPLTNEAAAAQLKVRKQTFLVESTRRQVPKRNIEERRRENRSPFTEELGNRPSSASNPLLLPGVCAKEKRQRERTPSPGNRRLPRERRSPSPKQPRYANRTSSLRFGGSSFTATAASRRLLSPSHRYRHRTPPRR